MRGVGAFVGAHGSVAGFVCLLAGCAGSPFSSSPNAGSSGSSGSAGTDSVSGAVAGSGGDELSPNQSAAGASSKGSSGGAGGGTLLPADESDAEAGAAGAGGAAVVEACPSAVADGYQVGFFPELRGASSQEVHPFFELSTTSAAVALERLSLRYYFSKEADAPETGSCYWVTGERCASVQLSWHDLDVPTPSADRYLELRFIGAEAKLSQVQPTAGGDSQLTSTTGSDAPGGRLTCLLPGGKVVDATVV